MPDRSAKWTAADLGDLTGRTMIVTGATSGLGTVTTRALAKAGARVVLAVRDVAKGNALVERLSPEVDGPLEVRELDLASLDSVRAFAAGWDETLDVLVNNAGVMAIPLRRSADGHELQLATNHLGPFALTLLLLPHVADRVVTVSSMAHRNGRIALDDLDWQRRRYQRWGAYGQTKLANLLFTLQLQRRLDGLGSPLRAVAAHPGYAATNLQLQMGNKIADQLGRVGNAVFAQSDEMGALPTLYAATQDLPGASFVGPDGFMETRGHPTLVGRSAAASDLSTAEALWAKSEELTGVTFPATLPPR